MYSLIIYLSQLIGMPKEIKRRMTGSLNAQNHTPYFIIINSTVFLRVDVTLASVSQSTAVKCPAGENCTHCDYYTATAPQPPDSRTSPANSERISWSTSGRFPFSSCDYSLSMLLKRDAGAWMKQGGCYLAYHLVCTRPQFAVGTAGPSNSCGPILAFRGFTNYKSHRSKSC